MSRGRPGRGRKVVCPLHGKHFPGRGYPHPMVLRARALTLEARRKLRRIVLHGQNAIESMQAQIVLAS